MVAGIAYLVTPFVTWGVVGCLKFLINSIRAGKLAFEHIGYGGMPSNHSAIVSAMAALIGCKEGIDTAAFGVAVTLAFIVMLDAGGLRVQIGKQARRINLLEQKDPSHVPLRERIGHTRLQIAAGILTGVLVGFAMSRF